MSEKKLSIAALKKKAETETRAAIEERLTELPRIVTRQLEDAAFGIITASVGLKRSWHDAWEIDNCNGHKRALSDDIGRHVVATLKSKVNEWLDSVESDPKLLTGFKKAFAEQYKREFRYAMERIIGERAKAKAQRDIEALLNREPDEEAASEAQPAE